MQVKVFKVLTDQARKLILGYSDDENHKSDG